MNLLFLQGSTNGFFARLARHAAGSGHAIHKVNYCGGDELFWRSLPAQRFTSRLDALDGFYRELFARVRPDAVLMFNSHRPVHRPALAIAAESRIPTWVFEDGYFRPNWLTMDFFGMGPRSCVPRDPEAIRELAQHLPASPPPRGFDGAWGKRAWEDTGYHLATGAMAWCYPHYRTHRAIPAHREYAGWIKRSIEDLQRRQAYRDAHDRAMGWRGRMFLLPLQLDGDCQIRINSPLPHMRALIDHALRSFAAHAPADAFLAIKRHPLDDGLVDRFAFVARLSRELGVADRVGYFAGGLTTEIVQRASAVVTVNSTVGTLALDYLKPVKTLGDALYNVPGVVSGQSLDEFWRAPRGPDVALLGQFRHCAIALTQINGSLYSTEGQDFAARQALGRIERPQAWLALAPTSRQTPRAAAIRAPARVPAPVAAMVHPSAAE